MPVFLSDRDLRLALQSKQLIVDPPPEVIDTTSIDVHLDHIDQARVWDVPKYAAEQKVAGHDSALLMIGKFNYKQFSQKFTKPVPLGPTDEKVFRDGNRVVVRPGGFLLWQTKQNIGTPEIDPRLVCFIEGKSTRARTGILVHLTAPTIHAGWWGKVTLEIANLGPFDLGLMENDAIAQITVAAISSPPSERKRQTGIDIGQGTTEGVK
jgi:dCTP deaminase